MLPVYGFPAVQRLIKYLGFWLTFVALILLLLAGCTVCFGHRRDRASGRYGGGSYPAAAAPVPSTPALPDLRPPPTPMSGVVPTHAPSHPNTDGEDDN